MERNMRQILKASEVQFEAPVQLGLVPGATSAPAPPQPAPAAGPMQARARIAETNAEYALIELTCACGQTTYLRCDYEPAQT